MVLEDKRQLAKFSIIALTALASIKLWSFSKIKEGEYNLVGMVILLCLIAIILYGYNKIHSNRLLFKYNVHLFLWIPFLSAYGALLFHHQPISLSVLVLRTNFYWLLYFVLHIFDIPKQKIINLLIFIGLVWVFLTIIQQFTYPRYYFFSRDDNEESIYRAGVYRFMVLGHHYGDFVLFYFFYNFLIKRKFKSLLIILFGLIGFYFFGTRQFALSAVACLCISAFFVKGIHRIYMVALLIVATLIIINYRDYLFGQYVELTAEQLKYGDDIRLLSANFFFSEYWPNKLAKIIGNGQAYATSQYGKEMLNINLYFHYYRSDVGIIGAFNQFGILYALNILWLNIKGLTGKYYTYENRYLILFFLNALLLIVLSEYYSNPAVIPFYCFILYLTDKSLEEKKLIEQNIDSQLAPHTILHNN